MISDTPLIITTFFVYLAIMLSLVSTDNTL